MVIPRRVVFEKVIRQLLLGITLLHPGFGICAESLPENRGCASSQDGKAQATRELIGVTWKWQQTIAKNGTRLVAPNPDNYTLQFLPEGKISVRLDCNIGRGLYEINENAISITITSSTRAACPPESFDQVFIRDLNSASRYFLRGDSFYIEKQDDGTMEFLR